MSAVLGWLLMGAAVALIVAMAVLPLFASRCYCDECRESR